jgi:hypothetical protein
VQSKQAVVGREIAGQCYINLIFSKSRLSSGTNPITVQTVILRFTSLTDLTTFSHMVGTAFPLNTSELTISGSIPHPYVSIAQNVFEATVS